MTTSVPDFSTPKALFCVAEEILGEASIGPDRFTLGGGTALALRIQHRESRDIDVFFTDAQLLTSVTPRRSEAAKRASGRYDESSNHVKIYNPRDIEGEIDFIASALLTDEGWERREVWGRTIRLETGAEIVAKKFFHRAALLTARDVFDLAAALAADPDSVESAAPVIAAKVPLATDRIEKLNASGRYEDELKELRVAAPFQRIARTAPALALRFLREIR